MTLGHWTTRVHGLPIRDSTGLGRWTGITLRGTNKSYLSILTAYRCCNGSIKTAPLGSTFAREFNFQKDSGDPRPNPRSKFTSDLAVQINTLIKAKHMIILMLDANTIISDNSNFQNFVSTCELHDLHSDDPANSTYIGSPHRRIDYMFGSADVLNSISQSGTLSYIDGPPSDHRGMYVDMGPLTLFGELGTPQSTINPATTRILKSGNPESVETYNTLMLKYFNGHNMIKRMKDMNAIHETTGKPVLRHLLEK